MKKMKRLFAALFICLICIIPAMNVRAAKEMNITAQTNSQSKITIRWKKKAKIYKVYRTSSTKNNKPYNWKRIKTLSSSKRSYVDSKVKKNKSYYYMVKAYNKSGKSYKLVYKGDTSASTKLCSPYWKFDEQSYDYLVYPYTESPQYTTLAFSSSYGINPTGFKIYRCKAGTKSYTKIATVKAKKNKYSYIYKDKSVQKGTTYYYKIKSYYKKGKKVINSGYSETIRLSAVNPRGKYKINLLTKPQNDLTELLFKVTSDSGNADLRFNDGAPFTYGYDDEHEGEPYNFILSQYSKDGKSWKEISNKNKLTIHKGETIYLRLKSEDGKKIPFLDIYNSGERVIETDYCLYDVSGNWGIDGTNFEINLDSNSATTYPIRGEC